MSSSEHSTKPEDLFIEIFSEVFGLEKVQYIIPQMPFTDIYGVSRFVDYALQTAEEKIAFEIDGLAWHHPGAISLQDFEDDLLRQNCLVARGWRVFRWTDRELAEQRDRVRDQLALFLEGLGRFMTYDDFLPPQLGDVIEFRDHQEEALRDLGRLRGEGKTIALLDHATGTGKTVTAIADARRIGGRTLFLTHRRHLVQQAIDEFTSVWPERDVGRFSAVSDEPTYNVVATVQSVNRYLDRFHPTDFAYLIIDEAHHATAATYKKILGYFTPKFILGLTATPFRADGGSVLELFQSCAHRLDLETAIMLGQLAPIRCFRVDTNIDLSTIRCNHVRYNQQDLEERVVIEGRDDLIVDTYRKYVPGRLAVVFCVNVRHSEDLARRFVAAGIAAAAVSGRDPVQRRNEILGSFTDRSTKVLCACDLLNEGWDCPAVEVLFMARPTLSKVLYLQQLGRGTRRHPGKESLVVFDFIDRTTYYNAAYNVHGALGKRGYRPGGLVAAPDEMIDQEDRRIKNGEKPTMAIDLGLWEKGLVEINIHTWQEDLKDMVSVVEAEMLLQTTEGFLQNAIRDGRVSPHHRVPVGSREVCYFRRDGLESIREELGLPKVDPATIKDRFLRFVKDPDMSASYKPVLLLCLMDCVGDDGQAATSDVLARFRRFYLERKRCGAIVEHPSKKLARIDQLSESEVKRVFFDMPFRKFQTPGFLGHPRDRTRIGFSKSLWRAMAANDRALIRAHCEDAITMYYNRLSSAS